MIPHSLIPQRTGESTGTVTRRQFVAAGFSAAVPVIIGCGPSATEVESIEPRLTARPRAPTQSPTLGLTGLGLANGRDGLLYVPNTYDPAVPMPLFVALHGAGGDGSNWFTYVERAETRGMALLAPDSRGSTWDLLRGGFGPDVMFLDAALAHVFDRVNVDAAQIALAGFSDGASYALSLGVSNGDLFSHLIGYSPGFLAPSDPIVGLPRVFISHGLADPVLSVVRTRGVTVPALIQGGYDVTYVEFDGGHVVPADISEAALDWFQGIT